MRGPWGAPTMMALEGGSFGLQAGGQATDFVLLLMSERSASSILTSKVKIGGDASAAAGPVGRNASAETDVTFRAEILTYSRARGLFAGISLAGSTLRPDNGGNQALYGKKYFLEGHRAERHRPAAFLSAALAANSQRSLAEALVESAKSARNRRATTRPKNKKPHSPFPENGAYFCDLTR